MTTPTLSELKALAKKVQPTGGRITFNERRVNDGWVDITVSADLLMFLQVGGEDKRSCRVAMAGALRALGGG